MQIPKVGDKVYVDTSLYLSHGVDDFRGGIATVQEVITEIIGDTSSTFIVIEERPGWKYNWEYFLEPKQEKLKKKFGTEKAHSDPDYRPEFQVWE